MSVVTPKGHLHLVAGISWIVKRSSWSFLANGLVLGLRVLCSCTTSLVVHARVFWTPELRVRIRWLPRSRV